MTENEIGSHSGEAAEKRARALPLRILHADCERNEALHCRHQLQAAGMPVKVDVVASKAAFVKALGLNVYDLVLTDYKLAGWSGLDVLRLLAEDGRDIPCIFVTSPVGEEMAVKCIKLGAADYILKDRPARLPSAVRGALEEGKAKEKRREFERTRHRLAAIIESSSDAIIGASEDGNIVNWNPGAERMFGYSAEEVYGKSLAALFSRDQAEGAGSTGAIKRYEAKGKKKNGQVMDVSVTSSPVRNSDGSAAGSSAIVRDVTEAKHQRIESLTTQKLEAIGQLAGGVAHDFNNLLTVINGYARMLQRKGGSDPAKLDAIVQAGERGQRLTKQLLVFSRKQSAQMKTLNLNALVLGFLNMLRPLIGDGIELRTMLAPDLASVRADAGQIEQVIMNLVINARDAMPEGGTITIRTQNLSREGAANEFGVVVLAISDTGAGMTPEIQSRIFEPFFTTKMAGGGTGLGLSTSLGIIQNCQGQLRVESTPGRGTTFTMQLAACATESAKPQAPASAEYSILTAPSGTVLLAEDDPTVREFILTVLHDGGYHVLAAENGAKALALCSSYPGLIHALVTDVVMPEMNGRALAKRARLIRPNLKVLFVSGCIDRLLKDVNISSPGSAFLEKPFKGEALLKIVDGFRAAAGETAISPCLASKV